MPSPIADDPRLAALLEADAALTAPGGAFELVEEEVLGEPMLVLKQRPKSLRDVLLAGAERFGDRDVYVWSDGRRSTFAGLVGEVAEVANGLAAEYGIGKGDRVAVCAANCPEYVLTFWACAALDAVLVAMNGWWTSGEMRNALELTQPKLVIMDEKRHARLEGDLDIPTVVVERDWASVPTVGATALPAVDIGEDDPFELIFTSGTTGRPKAAVLSHRSVVSYLIMQGYGGLRGMYMATGGNLAAAPSGGEPPVRLATYPLFHVSGLSNVVGCVMQGAKSVWPLGRFDAGTVIELTKTEGINMWGGGVTHVVRLLDHPDVDTVDPKQIISIGVGGSATPPAVIDRIEETFPHLTGTTSSGYGSTETGLLSLASNWMLRLAPDTVGPPLPTVQIRITDDLGAEVPAGEPGNIEARSWMMMLGYYDNPQADADTIMPGRWIRTGDYGRLEDGILYISTRLRDLIIRGGENIYPFEIENRLDDHPEVIECAVFGFESAVYGQEVKAVVVVREGAEVDVAELQEFCAVELASYKVPAVIDITDEPLPRTASGKVMKHVLAGAENTQVEE
ncbi:MAG: class I adenylate-forming enzyme family protein [Acidimicrobiia bacterium]